MKRLQVDLGERTYSVLVGEGVISSAGGLLTRLGFRSSPIIVTNSTIFRLHGANFLQSLKQDFPDPRIIQIGDGERFKQHATLQKIYSGLFHAHADRRSWLAAFGGGVVGDIAGFAAATFMRGIPFVSIPTTLLSQVDSAIGGKVGINVPQGKNLIGAFHQPSAVLSDIAVLKTLPPRELAAGIYEVIKYGAIRSEGLLGYLERNLQDILKCRPAMLQHIVVESSRIKADVVARDERENELRMILNYGHTVGHALEAATSYRRFIHGEAVAWGMVAALGFGSELGLLDSRAVERLVALIHRVEKLPSLQGIAHHAVWNALVRDKKNRGGRIRMILLPNLGESLIRDDIDPQHLSSFLKSFLVRNGAA
jgi:3-dehydroquinate synthase